jgi:uncharacterized protein
VKRNLIRVLLIAISLPLAACNGVFYHPSRRLHGDAAKAGFAFEDRYFQSGSGNRLHGRLFRREPGTPGKGLWLFFHGNSRNLTGSYNTYAWVTKRGWDFFIFDYSGYGKSGGKASREALFKDGVAFLEYAADSIPMEPGEKLVLSGESLGGAVLLGSAAAWKGRGRASMVFVDCTFPSYRDAGQAILAQRIYAWPFQLFSRLLITDDHSPDRTLEMLEGIPMLVTHCREDGEIPFLLGKRLYSLAPSPKRFWTLEGCGHTQGFTDRFPGNRERLMAFVDSLPANQRVE